MDRVTVCKWKRKKSISKISYYVWMDQGEQCDNGNVTLINESLGWKRLKIRS